MMTHDPKSLTFHPDQVPDALLGCRYGDLLNALAQQRCILVGLYRARGSLGSELGHVATSPVPSSPICHGDSMFILRLDWRENEEGIGSVAHMKMAKQAGSEYNDGTPHPIQPEQPTGTSVELPTMGSPPMALPRV